MKSSYINKIKEQLIPPNSKRKLLAEMALLAVSKPTKVIKNLNKTNLRNFIYYFKTTEPSDLEERINRKLSKESAANPSTSIKVEFNEKLKLDKIKTLDFQPFPQPKVSIVLPVWNKWVYTYHCLDALRKNTPEVVYEVIIIDNASTDETPRMLQRINHVRVIHNETNLGFVEACNQGAKSARGEYLLLLNNDTLVTRGWLKSMVELAERDPAVGLVGAKLIAPDGRLQEAGGILWKNPEDMAEIYGRADNPYKWEFNYVKEVDYCSAACLLVRKDSWGPGELFDSRFAPAYFEDTDLAFRIRESGYKVMYQPQAEVIHFEGVTAGTDLSQGMKQYQEINREKFYQKWRSVLEKNHFLRGENIFLARDRSQLKKIMLFVDQYVPTYDKDAGSFITFEYLKIFLELGFKIIFWPDNLYKWEPYVSTLQQMGIEVVYGSVNFKRYMKKYGKYIQVACLSRPHIAINYIDDTIKYSKAKIIYIAHDLHFLREQRRALVENNAKFLRQVNYWKAKEFYLMEKSHLTNTFSDVEKEMIEKENPKIKAAVWPWVQPLNGAENDRNNFQERKDLVFIGNFAHLPNKDAVLWFAHEIFPAIRQAIAGAKFFILGSDPPKEILNLASIDIVVTDYVPDVSLYFDRAKVFIAPLRYGAGVKGKIIQAMSYGLPLVTTTIGAEGINLIDEENALIADKPEAFAEKCIRLYKDENLWNLLAKNSLHFVEENYSPALAKEKIKQLLSSLP